MPASTSVPFVPTFLLPLSGRDLDALWKFILSAMRAAGFSADERLAVMDVLAGVENDLIIARSDGRGVM
jgi:hypothetical protein